MNRTPQTQNLGYVECDNCGHPIEAHDTKGCTHTDDDVACSCWVKWTEREIRSARKTAGLSSTYNPLDIS